MKIRTRIFMCFLVIVLAGTYYLYMWISGDLRPRYLESMEESLVDTANILSAVCTANMDQAPLDTQTFGKAFDDIRSRSLSAQIYSLVKTNIDLRVYITDAQGLVVFDSDSGKDEGEDYSQWNDVYLTLNGKYGARTTRDNSNDPSSSVLYVSAPILVNNKTAGVLTVCKPTVSSNQFLRSAKRKIAISGILAGASVIVLGIVTSIWITRPIELLTRYAKAIRDGHRVPLPPLGKSEITLMGQAMEEMRDALEGKEYAENYVQTLTHEIKGPLSAIRGAVELMEEDMPDQTRREFLSNIQIETERIQRISDRLLLLSSLERRKGLRDLENIDIENLVRDITSSLQPLLITQGLSLNYLSEQIPPVRGERMLLRHAIQNLIRNAITFSPNPGEIHIALQQEGDYIILTIEDQGPGVPDYALSRIFERFYSLRQPDSGRKSSGLGLAIAQEAAALHGGSVSLENRPEGGARAILRICIHPSGVDPRDIQND